MKTNAYGFGFEKLNGQCFFENKASLPRSGYTTKPRVAAKRLPWGTGVTALFLIP